MVRTYFLRFASRREDDGGSKADEDHGYLQHSKRLHYGPPTQS
jgi:hypothetical protein